MRKLRGSIAVLLALCTVVGACGVEMGDDGLPAHCDRRSVKVIDYGGDLGPDAPTSYPDAVAQELRNELPRLSVSFPTDDPGDLSNDSNHVHPLRVVDSSRGKTVSLHNANGLKLLSVYVDEQNGRWIVSKVSLCSSLTKKFADA